MCCLCPHGWIATADFVERAVDERAQAQAELAFLRGRGAARHNAAWWVVIAALEQQIAEREAFLSHVVWC